MVAKRHTPIHHHYYRAHCWIWHDSWRLTRTPLFLQISTPITITGSTRSYAIRECRSSNRPSRCCADHQTYGICTWYDTPVPYDLFHTSCANTSQHITLGLRTEPIFSPSLRLCVFTTLWLPLMVMRLPMSLPHPSLQHFVLLTTHCSLPHRHLPTVVPLLTQVAPRGDFSSPQFPANFWPTTLPFVLFCDTREFYFSPLTNQHGESH